MPNYLEYQKSVAAEFKAYEKRVRNLIDDIHWGEEGHFKEVVLMNYLKRILPKNISAGTGFVRNGDNITNQIDIIIYDNTFPLLFSEGDFVIATPHNVIGIIEVKSNIEPNQICNILSKANRNGEVIIAKSKRSLFNGVFSFNIGKRPNLYVDALNRYDYTELIYKKPFAEIISHRLYSCVNHIAIGTEHFLKLWAVGQGGNEDPCNSAYYSLYKLMEGLAFSYFMSYLQEHIIRYETNTWIEGISEEFQAFLYPIKEGKEAHLLDKIYLTSKQDNSILK